MAFWRPEEELAELDEKIVLMELLELRKFLTVYLGHVRTYAYPKGDLERPKNLINDAAKHNALVAAHSRKALERLRIRVRYANPKVVSFLTKEEEFVIRNTLNIESALLILREHYDHFDNMLIQHESHLGQPRQSGYDVFLLTKQAKFILSELEKIIGAIKSLIAIEEDLKKRPVSLK